jgi:hypothetical protein
MAFFGAKFDIFKPRWLADKGQRMRPPAHPNSAIGGHPVSGRPRPVDILQASRFKSIDTRTMKAAAEALERSTNATPASFGASTEDALHEGLLKEQIYPDSLSVRKKGWQGR